MGNDIYRQLQQHLDRLPIPFPATGSGVEIRLLKKLFTEEEAEIALNLSALPERVSKIYKRISVKEISEEDLDDILHRMVKKGLINGVRDRNDETQFLYSNMPLAIGIFEAQVDKITGDLAQDFFEYEEEAFARAFLGKKTNQMRTIPLNVKIDPELHVSNYDDITEIIKNSPGPFAVINCICRQAKDEMGQTCKQTDIRETCIMIEDGVKFARNLDVGREISKDETLQLITRAKKHGLVLQPGNTQKPSFVCCCCGCCCGVLTAAKKFEKPAEFLHSNFYAEIDPDECEICDKCQERCPMDAIDRVNSHMETNLDRCIGCGACIPTCKSKAIKLIKKEHETVPPLSSKEMYKNIMIERFGLLKTLKFAAKAKMGQKV